MLFEVLRFESNPLKIKSLNQMVLSSIKARWYDFKATVFPQNLIETLLLNEVKQPCMWLKFSIILDQDKCLIHNQLTSLRKEVWKVGPFFKCIYWVKLVSPTIFGQRPQFLDFTLIWYQIYLKIFSIHPNHFIWVLIHLIKSNKRSLESFWTK